MQADGYLITGSFSHSESIVTLSAEVTSSWGEDSKWSSVDEQGVHVLTVVLLNS